MKNTNISTKIYTIFVLLLFLVYLSRSSLASIDSIAPENVKFDGNNISVQAEDIMLGKLLKTIRKSTGIEFELRGYLLERKISVGFKELSLLEGIRKIINPLSYAVVYDPDDKIRKVIIIDQGSINQGDFSTMMASDEYSNVFPPTEVYDGSHVMGEDKEPASKSNKELSKRFEKMLLADSFEGPPGFDANRNE